MRSLWKAALLAGVAFGAISTPALAQDEPAAEEAVAVDEVVVTVRRREESLLDVPVAVTNYSAERLEATGARDITDLTRTTPSLTMQVARGSNSTLISFIRGVGQQDPLWGFEPGVGLYIDDVYIARPQGAVLDIFDISRIEVLRGPQGTLYGRNTIGGAIKYVTDKIGEEPELRARVNLGSYSQRDFIVSGELPINDMLAVSGAVAKYDRDGYGENLLTGAEHYDKDVLAARASIEFSPADTLFFRLSGDLVEDDSNPRHGYRELPPSPGSVYDTMAGAGDRNSVETSGASLLAQWEASDTLTFKSITAYRAGTTEGPIDFDGLPGPILDIPAYYDDHQFSQEFQLVYSGDRVQAVAGVYYLNANAAGAFDTVVGAFNLTTFTAGSVDTESVAVFADVSFDVTERLAVSVGGRWTQDDKTGTVYRQQFLGIRSPFFGNAAAIPLAIRTDYTNSDTYEQFTPRVSATYEITEDLTVYGSYAQGFKSGGFDMRGDAVLYPDTVEGYDPETVTTYELGLKGSVLDRRLTFATAIFHSAYEDMQVTVQYPSGATVASVVDNVGEATIKGWELEASARFTDNLTANVMLSYIDAEFDEYLSFIPGAPGVGGPCAPNPPSPPVPAGCFVDVKDLRDFQNTPEWTGAISFNYSHPLPNGWGELNFVPAAAYRGDMQMFETAAPLLDQEAYWLIDASLVWSSEDDRYRVGLHGKNLTDEEYRVGGYNFPGPVLGDSVIGFYGPPRTWTVSLDVRF